MNVYMTEEEQLQQIRDWLKQYGPTILMSVFIAVVASMGWRYWKSHHENMLASASNAYEQMLNQVAQQNTDDAKSQATKIISDYPSSPYATLAAFTVAKIDVQQNQLADAEKQLFWAVDSTSDKAMKNLAIVRLARVMIAENKANQAADLLGRIKDKSYAPLVLETKGDAYVALKQIPEAKQAYQQSLDAFTDNKDPNKAVVQMKLNDL